MLVVTGKNHTRYTELLAQRQSPTTHIYGFVADMDLLMAASDVVITKAGPGTLMEALVMQRPVIITEAVGMQEQGNIDFVLNHDIGFYCPTLERIKHTLDMLQHPPRYAALVDRLQGAMPTDGATQIAHMVREMCDERTDANEQA
jgi:UDP-N-acetylglucosamine:LPS N-acetylglucosamine transferase